MSEHQILLEAHDVAKHFGGVKALHDVSLTIRRGEIYGLIGPNGAGKTTFFNCLTGLYTNESGHFVFDGVKLPPGAGEANGENLNFRDETCPVIVPIYHLSYSDIRDGKYIRACVRP